jgi:hypothetical protein
VAQAQNNGHSALTDSVVDADKEPMVWWHARWSDNEGSRGGRAVLLFALGLIPVVFGAMILSASGAPTVVVVALVVLGLAFNTVSAVGVFRSQRVDGPTTTALSPTTEPMGPASAVRYRTSRLLVGTLVGGAAFVTGAGTLGLVAATVVGTNRPPIWFTAAFILGSAVIWYALLTVFTVDIAVWPSDGRVVFHCLAKDRQTNLAEITAISYPPVGRQGNAVTVRYRGGAARVLMYLDWNDFIRRVRERNPGVEVKGF